MSGRMAARRGENIANAHEQVPPLFLCRRFCRWWDIRVALPDTRQQARHLCRRVSEHGAERVRAHSAFDALDDFDEWRIGIGLSGVVTATGQEPQAAGVGFGADLFDQPRLSCAGVAGDRHEAAVSATRRLGMAPQRGPLDIAIDEGQCRLERRWSDRLAACRLEQPPLLDQALEPERATIDEGPIAAGSLGPHEIGDQQLAGHCLRCHPRRDGDRQPEHVVGLFDECARVDSHANTKHVVVVTLVVLPEPLLDVERTRNAGRRRLEHDEEAIAGRLDHPTVVLCRGLAYCALVHAHQRNSNFVATFAVERGRTLHVGEQHRFGSSAHDQSGSEGLV